MTLIDPGGSIAREPVALAALGRVRAGRRALADIEFGWPLLGELVAHGIGHAVVVRERDVIAVQAAEALEEMIARAGGLCRTSGWVLLVAERERARTAVTASTVEKLAAAGGRYLVLPARAHDDREPVVRAADRAKIAVYEARSHGDGETRPP